MREEEKKRSSQNSGTQRKNRWIFPAVYIAAAALLLTAVVWFTSTGDDVAKDPTKQDGSVVDNSGDIVEVNNLSEKFAWPVENPDEVKVVTGFWDSEANTEDQEAALVFYDNRYLPNKGIDIAMENGESFNVVASMAGVVKEVRDDAELGNVIEIQHAEGVVTMYQSVTDIQVEVGDQVEQGQVLAMAGQSQLNESAGVHTHFEVRVDGQAIDPLEVFNKSLSALNEMITANEDENAVTEDEDATTDEGDADTEDGQSNPEDESEQDPEDEQDESPDASIGQDEA